jgi:type IV pilus assembly protein PilV
MAVNLDRLKNGRKMPSSQSGLMMIEVLISILIFSIGILGIIGLQAKAIEHSGDAQNRNIASSLANDLVAQMWLAKSADPSNATLAAKIVAWKTRVTNSQLPNATGTVLKSGDVTNIAISYKPPQKKASENASQYVTQIAIP